MSAPQRTEPELSPSPKSHRSKVNLTQTPGQQFDTVDASSPEPGRFPNPGSPAKSHSKTQSDDEVSVSNIYVPQIQSTNRRGNFFADSTPQIKKAETPDYNKAKYRVREFDPKKITPISKPSPLKDGKYFEKKFKRIVYST